MKRGIKLRVWDPNAGIMYFGNSVTIDGDGRVTVWPRGSFEPNISDDLVPMQFTGLMDAGGIDIYEGDIVRFIMNGQKHQRPVAWNPMGSWSIQWSDGINPGPMRGEHEIIGNIYENKDLIK